MDDKKHIDDEGSLNGDIEDGAEEDKMMIAKASQTEDSQSLPSSYPQPVQVLFDGKNSPSERFSAMDSTSELVASQEVTNVTSSRDESGESSSEAQERDNGTTEHPDTSLLNEWIVNEILHDRSDTVPENLIRRNQPSGKLAEIQAQIKSTIEKAFWDGILEALENDPPDYSRVVQLVKEVRDELDALVPSSWKQELHESIDIDLLGQILESGNQDVGYLSQLLDYVINMVIRLGAPARDDITKAAHEKLLEELSEIVAAASNKSTSFSLALVKGIKFCLEQIQILKQDISFVKIEAMILLIKGHMGIEYLQNAFSVRFGPPGDAVGRLPLTKDWLCRVEDQLDEIQLSFNSSVEALKANLSSERPLLLLPNLITSGRLPDIDINWNSVEIVLRLGIMQIMSASNAANNEKTPETLRLDIERLIYLQNGFQKIVVIATALLLVRQTLADKEVTQEVIESILKECVQDLDRLLDAPMLSIHDITQIISHACSPYMGVNSLDTGLLTRVLNKSLSAGDAIFRKVTSAVMESIRAIALVGKSPNGGGPMLAETSLKRIGGIVLLDLVNQLADELDHMALLTHQVHGPWYENLRVGGSMGSG